MKNKESAINFLNKVVEGKIDEAYEKYVNTKGMHHSMYFASGFPALKKAMKESHEKQPNKQFIIKHALEDGDMVAVHSHIIFNPKERGMAVVHLFRFKNGRIIEFWDLGQEIATNSPNHDGMF